MRQFSVRATGLGLAALLLLVGQAHAGPLNPSSFASLGTLDLTRPNSYTVDTDWLKLTGPGGVSFTGVLSNGIAVFDFSGITIDAGATLTATGSHPLALLSQSSATINGTINVNGGDGGFNGGNGGSGGGGGRVLVEFGSGGFTNPNPSAVDVAGGGETGGFGTPGGMGVFTIQPLAATTPEPSSLVLLAIGGLGLLAAHRRRKNRHAPAKA